MSTQFQGNLDEIFSGSSTSATSRWLAANYVDKVLFANPSTVPLYWKPGLRQAEASSTRNSQFVSYGKCRPIPGLPEGEGWDGVEVFAGKVFLWRDDLLKWSDRDDFANWIPVSITATAGRGKLSEDLRQPSTGKASDFAYLEDVSGSFTEGQFVRNVAYETDPSSIAYSYYRVESVSRALGSETQGIPAAQSVSASAVSSRVYTTTFPNWALGIRVRVDGEPSSLEVINKSRDIEATYTISQYSAPIPNITDGLEVYLTTFPFELRVGDVVSIGRSDMPGQDLYEVLEVGRTLRVKRLGIGEDPHEIGYSHAPGSYVRFQPWVEVQNKSTTPVGLRKSADLSVSDGLKLSPLNLTGELLPNQWIPGGSVFETINSNEAGELRNVGNGVSGPIYAFVTLADFALILKRDSIQSVQDVAREAGSIYVRGEVFGEGPIGRYAWARFAERDIVFWGQKGWYRMSGGQSIQQIGIAHWNECDAEMDRSRSDEIVAYHSRHGNEVWFAYPTTSGETKVAIYNYESDSVVTDTYDSDLHGITALGEVDWELATTWEMVDPAEIFTTRNKKYYEFVDLGERAYTVIAIGGDAGNADNGEDTTVDIPRLLLHGRVFTRSSRDDCDPQPYQALAETPDFDFGQPEVWKYVDTVYLHVHVPTALGASRTLKVQVGGRSTLSSDVTWSSVAEVDVQGGTSGPVTLKANCRGSGRLIRLRFYSDEASVQWRISGYRIIARAGNTY